MDLMACRGVTGIRSLSSKEAYSDRSSLTATHHRRDSNPQRTICTPVHSQKTSIKPGGGTVKFKGPVTEMMPSGGILKGGFFGTSGKKKGGTVQLTGTASLRGRTRARDPNTVFVTGSTGTLGSRIVRELLSMGYKVRAACSDVEEAQNDLDVLIRYDVVPSGVSRGVSLVEIDWSDENAVLDALGSAGKVIFTGEGGPAQACITLVEKCEELGVFQFILVTSPAGKAGSSGALFGGMESSSTMKQAQAALERSSLSFTVIQPGNMERVSDSLRDEQNVVVGRKGGQISKLQVAEFIASCCSNAELAENRIYDVATDASVDYTPYEELLQQVPMTISKEDQLSRRLEKEQLQVAFDDLEDKVNQLEAQEEDAKERIVAIKEKIKQTQTAQRARQSEATSLLRSSAQVEKQLQSLIDNVAEEEREEAVARALYASAQKASKETRMLSKEEQKEIAFAVLNPEIVKQREEEEAQRKKEEEEAAKAKAAAEEEKRKKIEAEKKLQEEKKAAAEAAKAKAAEEARKKKEQAEIKAAAEAEEKKKAAEAKAKAAAEAKEKAEKEAKAKAEAQAKAKAEAEAKAKAEKEARLKAAAEAKAKAEEEARLKAEAKAKAEAEAKAKAEEEARLKAEAKAKAEAEAKAKAEEEARLKAEAEAKAKAEEAARLKAEAEVKAKAEAEAKAEEEARLKAEAEAKAKAEEEEAKAKAKAEAAAAAAKKQAEEKAKAKAANQSAAVNPFEKVFAAWKAPWDQASSQSSAQATEDDGRPTAREWIDAWRARQSGNTEASAKEWIQNWRDKQTRS